MNRRGLLRAAGLASAAALAGCKTQGTAAPAPPPPSASAVPVVDWKVLEGALHGTLVRPGAAAYAQAAQLYNPRFDSVVHPAAIARCATADDVAAGVRFAADNRVAFAVRSGGHSYGGWSSSAGLVIDVSALNSVTVDTANGVARIGAGAKLSTVYAALAAKGVAIAGGSCPTVGIAGLAMGGGIGVLTRAFGLTCDAIRGVDIVTADGSLRQADQNLLWALKGGGGGSFGAVTSFTMAVRPAPTIHTFYYAWNIGDAYDVLDAWHSWDKEIYDEPLWSTCKVLANRTTGRQQVMVSGTWTGPASELDDRLRPLLHGKPKPASSSRHTLGYGEAMRSYAGSGAREAFAATSSVVIEPMGPKTYEMIVKQVGEAMEVDGLIEGGISFDAMGGAAAVKRSTDDTAFFHRHSTAIVQYTATYQTGAQTNDTYVRGFREAMKPWFGEFAYANYADPSIQDYGKAYWWSNYPRLQQVKKDVDPHNLFTFPQAVALPS